MSQFVLGIDIGTTSVKVVLISSEGYIFDEENISHDLISLNPNWAEENANVWWNNVVTAVNKISQRNPQEIKQLRCIGCSGMVPAIVLLDEKGEPVRNTIQQNDARAINQIERLTNELDQENLFLLTGGKTNQQHILPRLLWVKENEPEAWKKVKTVLGSYDYITYKLTGQLSLEINWAVESGSFDIFKKEWLVEDLNKVGISSTLFPPVHDSIDVVGTTLSSIENLAGIPVGTPVIAGSADHVASTLAAGIVESGDLLIKFGGAGDILFCVDEIKTSKKLFFDYHIVPNKYLLNGCMAASGSLVKWFVKDIMNDSSTEVLKKLDSEAMLLKPAADGLVVLPYFLGEKTPLFDPTARGVFFGLTLSHSRAHMFRAILESVIYGFKHHVEVLEADGCIPKRILATNGGAKSKFWCQIAADVLGETICSYPSHPGSALGVAFLAGMSVNVFQDWSDIQMFLKDSKIYTPNHENVKIYERSYKIYRDLYMQLRDSFDALQALY